jgi:hypothetical protein
MNRTTFPVPPNGLPEKQLWIVVQMRSRYNGHCRGILLPPNR